MKSYIKMGFNLMRIIVGILLELVSCAFGVIGTIFMALSNVFNRLAYDCVPTREEKPVNNGAAIIKEIEAM